jgi:hypothetical protein
MPISIFLANLVIPKKVIEEKYTGGIMQFRIDQKSDNLDYLQEDEDLFSLIAMNYGAFDVYELEKKGLNKNDFVILLRHGAYCLWEVDWLEHNNVFCWHKMCKTVLIKKAKLISGMNMNVLAEEFDKGNNFFKSF